MAFFLEYRYRGQDAYPLLFKALEDPAVAVQDKVRFEMMRRLGYFVTESSEHQSEYVPYFIHHGEKIIDEYIIPIDEYRRCCEAIIATWQQEEKDLLGEGAGKVFEVAPQSNEYGSYIIHAREANEPIVIYGNVPNRGLITNLPNGCCVEVPVLVDANGLQPTHIGNLPPQLAAICRTNVNVQDLTVEAALTKKREHIYQAVMMDPHTSATLTLDTIWAMCDEMIEAHQKDGYMGEFSPVIKNTGRPYQGTGDRAIARLEAGEVFSFHAGATNELELVVENPGNQSLSGRIDIQSSNNSVQVEGIDVAVDAESSKSYSVTVTLEALVDEPIDFVLETSETILSRGIKLSPRIELETDESGHSKIQLHLGVKVAATGTIFRDEKHLYVDMTVNDSDIRPAKGSVIGIMAGSAIEVRLAANDQAEVKTVNIIPGKRGEESTASFSNTLNKAIETGSIQQSTTQMNYRIQASIPLEEFGLDGKSESALIEIRTVLSALGDAHSGGATCLSGQPGRKSSLPYFHKIIFKNAVGVQQTQL
jgi:alpha-galactosidase